MTRTDQNDAPARKALREIKKSGHLEDRREYEPDQLARMYQLDEHNANRLYQLIQDIFDPNR